jgi:nitrite reductase (NADH) large subunit
MKKENLVVIGNGMAGMRTVEELLKLDGDRYDITVFGAEPHPNYNRILLSPVLAGEKTINDIILNSREWYADNDITLHTGDPVVEIDRVARMVRTAGGTEVGYDRLLLATGSNPFMIPVPGADLPGVIGFRDINDVDAMLDAAASSSQAVVIGGGLLGLEAANGLMKQGMEVTVVHLMDCLMERQLDATAANMLQQSLEARGMKFRMAAQTTAITGNDHVTGVSLADGSTLPADLVVMAVGIRPNIDLAQRAGLHCDRGVLVSDTLQTFDPRIYAVGECVQHRGQCYGLVAPLFEQARVCANHLAQLGYSRYAGSVTSTKLKVTGIDLFSAGDFSGGEGTEEIVLHDPGASVYKKLVIRDNRVIGAVLYGDTTDGAWYFQLMRDETDIRDLREHILFGEAHLGDSGHGGENRAMLMSDEQQVCDCNGVCKGEIVTAITSKGLFTLDDVKAHTKAAASCGSCTGLVEQLLASTLGSDYSAPEAKPLCKCTEHTHDEVRKAIFDRHLTDLDSVYRELNWRSADGCHVCRPAINYYLLSSWPAETHDDNQSRFINERVHANIQKDGTYSVVPRIFGGETSPAQLRAIAEVAEKYAVPTVKFTGGQRLDLLGIRKEQLPHIWKDLSDAGFVSGHAYGKAMRTVKTCVGSEWCRFGVQNSTRMGIELEELTWGSWMPHKFKLAVSGCPRNCAEATIKDFGVVAIDSGWELHVGGNGGVKVRATDLLCRVTTSEEVKEYCAAFTQLYREEARYLERTAPWVERVGLTYIRERVVDDEAGRKSLAERFAVSQQYSQVDPWKARGEGVDAHEYTPLKDLTAAAAEITRAAS